MSAWIRGLGLLLVSTLSFSCGSGQTGYDSDGGGSSSLVISFTPFSRGLSRPVGIYNAGAGDDRLFVIEQAGLIRIVQADGTLRATPFLDISDRVDSTGPEMGLLGLAFHPEYGTTGNFFVNYTHTGDDGIRRTRISRFSVTGDRDVADPVSEVVLLTVDQPFPNHNAGAIHFGPDRYLYIPLGDGGSGGDPSDNAQNPGTLLGKISRIDVDLGPGPGPGLPPGTPQDCAGEGAGLYAIPPDNPFLDGFGGTCDEIWALGLRNPWRSSFDRLTGDLFIGDVGQSDWEEIDYLPAGSPGGKNFGWRCFEGNHPFNPEGCGQSSDYTFPIFEYSSSGDDCSVIGGNVYRGSRFAALYGRYLLLDLCTGHFRDLAPNGQGGWSVTEHFYLNTLGFVAFGENSEGELFLANILDGRIYRVEGN